jgi:alpha-ketoglutarate-dependent taurine dioxygenase
MVDDRPMLTAPCALPPPPWLAVREVEADDRTRVVERLRVDVARDGCAAVQLDRPFATHELLTVGQAWGPPIPEHAPTTQPFVEAGCILHLVVQWGRTDDVDRQPFSASPILLHTEGSRRPTIDQPRYLLFDCLVPPAPESGGQTVVVRMSDVVAALDTETRAVLSATRYAGTGMPPVLRRVAESDVVCFRDFAHARPELGTDVDPARVDQAFTALVTALYDPRSMFALPWRSNMLVLLDNRRVFHGRTAICETPHGWDARHLRRIRTLDPEVQT